MVEKIKLLEMFNNLILNESENINEGETKSKKTSEKEVKKILDKKPKKEEGDVAGVKDEKNKTKGEKEVMYDSPVYAALKNTILTWAQIADKMVGYNAKSAADRSKFGKKAHRWKDKKTGYKYGFTRNEIKEIMKIID